MQPFNVMALFCKDIYEEEDGGYTLVRVLRNAVNLPGKAPGALPKLIIYIRINFIPTFDLGEAKARMVMPSGETIPLWTFDAGWVRNAQESAQASGSPLAGVLSRIIIGGFQPPSSGTVSVEVEIKGETYLAGALTFVPEESSG